MTDRLDDIKRRLAAYRESRVSFEELGSFLSSDDLDWLVGEVERLRRLMDKPLWAIWQQVEKETREQWFGDKREVERLRGLLARLEWAGTHCERDREMAACPVCNVVADSEVVGQLPHVDCWLAAELHPADPNALEQLDAAGGRLPVDKDDES